MREKILIFFDSYRIFSIEKINPSLSVVLVQRIQAWQTPGTQANISIISQFCSFFNSLGIPDCSMYQSYETLQPLKFQLKRQGFHSLYPKATGSLCASFNKSSFKSFPYFGHWYMWQLFNVEVKEKAFKGLCSI